MLVILTCFVCLFVCCSGADWFSGPWYVITLTRIVVVVGVIVGVARVSLFDTVRD
jgi:hypothetical protein